MLDINKIYCTDCLDGMKLIEDGTIDMILCDLPYGITAQNKWDVTIPFEPLWCEYTRVIKENGAIVLFAGGMFTAELMMSNRRMWHYNLVWQKTLPVGFLNANRMPLRSHEDICVFYKKLPTYNPQKTLGHKRVTVNEIHRSKCHNGTVYGAYGGHTYDSTERYPTSVLTFAADRGKGHHPTQKPVALLEWLIRTYTNEGELVLDNCIGSGSTAIACMQSGRNFIGFENDERFFCNAQMRIRDEVEIKKGQH